MFECMEFNCIFFLPQITFIQIAMHFMVIKIKRKFKIQNFIYTTHTHMHTYIHVCVCVVVYVYVGACVLHWQCCISYVYPIYMYCYITGRVGRNCEVLLNQCESSPCQHNGFCEVVGTGWQCHCGQGYTGPTCSTKVHTSIKHTIVYQITASMRAAISALWWEL